MFLWVGGIGGELYSPSVGWLRIQEPIFSALDHSLVCENVMFASSPCSFIVIYILEISIISAGPVCYNDR